MCAQRILYRYHKHHFREIFSDLCGGELRHSIEHPIRTDEELFLLFDFTHSLISIYDDFKNKEHMNPPTVGHEHILGRSSGAEFSHIVRLYELEEDNPLKNTFQLKNESLSPTAITTLKHALGEFESDVFN